MKTKITLLIAIFMVASPCVFSQPWTWSQFQLSSYARMGLAAAIMDDTIFFSAGKKMYGAFGNTWDMYDINEQQWDTYETSSTPRFMYATVSAGGKVFGAGGNNYPGWGNFTDVDIYDKETGEWTVEHLTRGRSITGGAVACGNKVFFAGGHIHTGPGPMDYAKVIDIYDTDTETWSVDSLSIGRCFIGAVATGGKVYFAGGATGEQEVTNVIDIYDTATGNWTVKYLSEAKGLIAAVAYGDKIYFAGGAKPYSVTTTLIEVYNITTGSWEDTMNLQTPRIVTALKVENSLVFTGAANWVNFTGVGYIGPPNGVVEIYYPETNQWDYTVSNLTPARYTYAWTSYGNKAYYAGGYTVSAMVSTISVLEYVSHCLPDGITFSTQEEIDNFQINYPGCIEIEGDATISGDDIDNLSGLNVITVIGGDLNISGNDILNDLSGLDSITGIGGNLKIIGNPVLSELTGLYNIASIGGNLEIMGNEIITSLSGLENIESESIVDLSIWGNSALTECDIWNICYYLNNTSGNIEIHDNAGECETQEDVVEACLTDIGEISATDELKIYPNPMQSTTLLQYTLNQNSHVTIKIFDLTGQEIIVLINEYQQQGEQQIIFNTNDLKTGIYFCVLKINYGMQTKKMIKL